MRLFQVLSFGMLLAQYISKDDLQEVKLNENKDCWVSDDTQFCRR